jgi:hypothetical protein
MNSKTLSGSNSFNLNCLWMILGEVYGSDGWNRTNDLGVMNPTL